MFQLLKEKAKRHLNRQLLQAARDIDSARQFRAAQESADFVDHHMPMAKSYPDKFALLKSAIAQIEVDGVCCEFGVYRGSRLLPVRGGEHGLLHIDDRDLLRMGYAAA